MDLGLGSLIGSGMGGGLMGFGESWYNNRQADKRQHQAQDFEEQMYDTRYQKTVADLKAAGLNPMLAYQQGTGGSVPGSSAASAASSGNVVSGYNQTRLASANEANLQADTENKKVINDQIRAQTGLYESSAEMNRSMIQKIEAEIVNTKQNLDNLRAQWLKDTSDARLKDAMQASEQWYQRLIEQQERLLKNQIMISNPKAQAAATTGAFAAHGENLSIGLSPITDFLKFAPKAARYPKRAGED